MSSMSSVRQAQLAHRFARTARATSDCSMLSSVRHAHVADFL